jgi:hypothetical protein
MVVELSLRRSVLRVLSAARNADLADQFHCSDAVPAAP